MQLVKIVSQDCYEYEGVPGRVWRVQSHVLQYEVRDLLVLIRCLLLYICCSCGGHAV